MSEILANIKCMVNTIWSVWGHDLEDRDNVLTRSWDGTKTLLQCCGIKTVLVRSNIVIQVCPLNMLSQVEHGWQIWMHSVCYHKLQQHHIDRRRLLEFSILFDNSVIVETLTQSLHALTSF